MKGASLIIIIVVIIIMLLHRLPATHSLRIKLSQNRQLPLFSTFASLNNSLTQASSRSLGSSSTDSSQGSQSTASSRKSSNSSSLSTDSSGTKVEISRGALEEIAAFERFIEDYFELACDNNNLVTVEKAKPALQGRISASSSLSEVLELSI